MSWQRIVHAGITGRLHLRRIGGRLALPRAAVAMRIPSESMRGLETLVAFTAIAAAIVIGLGR